MSPIKSYTSKSGRTVHYDENGNRVGVSYRSLSGGRVTHYDAKGNETGRSYVSPSGRMTHYDASGEKTGTSYTAYPKRIQHYDNQWNKTGDTCGTFFGTTTVPTGKPGAESQSGAEASGSGCLAVMLLVCGAVGLILLGLIG